MCLAFITCVSETGPANAQPPFAPAWIRLQDVLLPVEYTDAPVVVPADADKKAE